MHQTCARKLTVFAWQAQAFRQVAIYAAGTGIREGCKNIGRRGGFEEGLNPFVSYGRCKDFVLCDDTESVEGLQISCHGSISLQDFFVAGAILLKYPLENRQNVLEF